MIEVTLFTHKNRVEEIVTQDTVFLPWGKNLILARIACPCRSPERVSVNDLVGHLFCLYSLLRVIAFIIVNTCCNKLTSRRFLRIHKANVECQNLSLHLA